MRVTSLLTVAALVAVPFATDSFTAYQLGLYLLYGIVGQGIALCWGRAGFLPLGQALFFGTGAYIAGWALQSGFGWALLLPAVLAACLVPALVAGLVGVLVFNRQIGSGPYFSLITLALAMLGFQAANSLDWLTGGFNGMTGINGLPGVDTYETLYFYIVGALVVTTLMLAWVMKSPFGQLLKATNNNEERLQFFGFRTSLLKAAAFAISGGVAGLAGALYAPHQGIVTPQSVGFLLSAELVIWTAVGGRNGLAGPVIGAVLIGFLASGLRDIFAWWEVVVALVFVLVVLRLPDGIEGLLYSLSKKLKLPGPVKPPEKRTLMQPARAHAIGPDLVYHDVKVSVGPVNILRGFDFTIDKQGIHSIIGPNGAGKTSTFNVLTGKLPVTSGDITWHQQSLASTRPYAAARLGIGRKLQVPSIFHELTIAQNLDIAIWSRRIQPTELFTLQPFDWRIPLLDDLEEKFPFLRDGDRLAGDLSVGQRQMLDFAMTWLAEPDLVLLDEPCAGLSHAETSTVISAVAALTAKTGATCIIIEHDMQVVEQLSDHVIVLHQGALLANGSMSEIRDNLDVKRVYAGGTK